MALTPPPINHHTRQEPSIDPLWPRATDDPTNAAMPEASNVKDETRKHSFDGPNLSLCLEPFEDIRAVLVRLESEAKAACFDLRMLEKKEQQLCKELADVHIATKRQEEILQTLWLKVCQCHVGLSSGKCDKTLQDVDKGWDE